TIRETKVRFHLGDNRVSLARQTIGDEPPRTITTITASWPDVSLRCEVYPDQISVLRKLMLMEDIEIGSPDFDRVFVIKGNDETKVRDLLTPEMQRVIFRLAELPAKALASAHRYSIHLKWLGGTLTITKPRGHWSYERLEQFVLLSGELLNAAPPALEDEGDIEFLSEVRQPQAIESQCQVCGEPLIADVVYCAGCPTAHHRECWEYFGGCSTYACRQRKYVVAK